MEDAASELDQGHDARAEAVAFFALAYAFTYAFHWPIAWMGLTYTYVFVSD